MGRLDGKVALISGGARGQGAAEVPLFVQEGARVVFGDILDDEGRAVEKDVRGQGGEAVYVHLDVTREGDWHTAVSAALSSYGRLDILVNNAGVMIPGDIESANEKDWDRTMAINVKGTMLGTKCAIPAMRRSGGGSIVNISSGAGITPPPDAPPAYATSKGAIRTFSKVVALRHAADNIRCNSVHPGIVDTSMIQSTLQDPEMLKLRLSKLPLGRIGTPADIAYGVLYLASDESSFVTGSELVIDGGRNAM